MNDGSISRDLKQFFGAYFHQDWDLEADDWQGIVDGYVNDHPVAGLLRMLAEEIDTLRQARAEPDLEQFLVYTVGVFYLPEPPTYTAWLGQIAHRLRQHAATLEDRNQ
ncbi:contact-dependent growth inhibition system immunity protein [Mycobacterium sp. ACS4331]|uniref:contact-dependent growth inhibition system immunity protein n=1 Tax=Mycobacterium sp. ACS4331 TaxID=1834121 RepID=UPI0007FD7887|nr:contact-dependent growth inhibition system immunity protein [Mycobacterium sp. ACS4331]OBF18919.1 hypothetical protein A5727_10885 [Mycobacterium sp. ACS4331]